MNLMVDPKTSTPIPVVSDEDKAKAVKEPVPLALKEADKAEKAIPAIVEFGDDLYQELYNFYAAEKQPREFSRLERRWMAVQDNDHIKFVAIRHSDAFDHAYASTTLKK